MVEKGRSVLTVPCLLGIAIIRPPLVKIDNAACLIVVMVVFPLFRLLIGPLGAYFGVSVRLKRRKTSVLKRVGVDTLPLLIYLVVPLSRPRQLVFKFMEASAHYQVVVAILTARPPLIVAVHAPK